MGILTNRLPSFNKKN